jgi:hypothetical protein
MNAALQLASRREFPDGCEIQIFLASDAKSFAPPRLHGSRRSPFIPPCAASDYRMPPALNSRKW